MAVYQYIVSSNCQLALLESAEVGIFFSTKEGDGREGPSCAAACKADTLLTKLPCSVDNL